MATSIRIGNLTLRNIECAYIPTSEVNLLGGTFLSNFTYTIDERKHLVHFTPIYNNFEIGSPEPQKQQIARNRNAVQGYAEIDGVKYYLKNNEFRKAKD